MLKLKKLEMTNFMCVSHAELDFTDSNVVLLVGENGEGKSTVLEAIAFCLTESKKADTYKDFIKEFEESANVKLWADIQNKPISFDLTITEDSSTVDRKVVYGEGEDKKEYKNSEVSALLEKLGLIYYSEIIMSMQDKGDITALTPTKRAEYLSKLLNFDFSDKVKVLTDKLKEIKENIDYNVNQVEFNTKSIEDRKKEIKTVETLQFTESDITSLQNEISSLNNDLSSISEDIKKKDDLSLKRANVSNEIVKIEQEIVNLENCIKNEEEKKNQLKTLNDSKTTTENDLAVLRETPLNSIQDETALTSEVQKLMSESSDLNAELKIANKNIDLVNKGVCPECGHEFDDGDKEKYETALKEVTEKLDAVSKSLTKKQSELTTLKESNNTARQNNVILEQKISAKVNELESLNKQISMVSSNNGIDYNAEIEAKNNLLNTKNKELQDIEKEISSMPDLSAKQKEISSNISSKQFVLNDYNQKLLQNNMTLQNNQKIAAAITEMENKIEGFKKNIESYRNQKANLDEEVQILDKLLPNYLIVKKCKQLETEINKFIQRIFPTMAIILSQGKKGVDLYYTRNKDKVKVFDKEHLKSIKMASGFEKAVVSIGFKVSLCIAYGLRFSFFDEIEQAATEKNSDILLRMLVTNDIFDQTFIITHKPIVRDMIKSVAPNLLTYYVSKGTFSTEEE